MYESLRDSDPIISDWIERETARQQETVSLIPSENHVSRAVMEAFGVKRQLILPGVRQRIPPPGNPQLCPS